MSDSLRSPGAFEDIHVYSDLDSGNGAQHHTLGPGKNQAAPGKHSHTAADLPANSGGGQIEVYVQPVDPGNLSRDIIWADVSTAQPGIQWLTQAQADTLYVGLTGNQSVAGQKTFTANILTLSYPAANTTFNISGDSGFTRGVRFQTGGVTRWFLYENSTAETGSDVGSDFRLARYNDAGTNIGTVFTITRSTGLITLAADPVSALGVATKQYVDAQTIHTLVSTKTTDSAGLVTFVPSEFGMTTFTGCFASVAWTASTGPTTPQFASARITSNTLQVRVWGASTSGGGATLSLLNAVSVTLYVGAW